MEFIFIGVGLISISYGFYLIEEKIKRIERFIEKFHPEFKDFEKK